MSSRAARPLLIRTRKKFLNWRAQVKTSTRIGLVPTMGALHSGHLGLVRQSAKSNALVIVTIFVNPTQFGPKEDLSKYPRQLAADLKALASLGLADGRLIVFAPKTAAEIYSEGEETSVVPPTGLTQILEGKFRPGHFAGVATVVTKLFLLTHPTQAFFGEKDYQQVCVIEKMVSDLFLSVQIVRCPTVRAKSGLALSSRNAYLSEDQRAKASAVYWTLKTAPTAKAAAKALRLQKFLIDYVEDWALNLSAPKNQGRRRRLAAVRLGGVRLIDSLEIKS